MCELKEYRKIEGNLLDQTSNIKKCLIEAMAMLIKSTLYRNIRDEDIYQLKKFIDTVMAFEISFEEGILSMNIPVEGMKYLHSEKQIKTNFKDENLNEVLEILERVRKALEICAKEVHPKPPILKDQCCFKLEEFEKLEEAIIEYSLI